MARRRRFGFKPPLRDTLAVNHAWLSFMAAAADKPPPEPLIALPPKRSYNRSGQPLEADVLRAVGDLLAQHPRVSYALRINSGAASYEAKSGAYAPVHFHIWVRSREPYRMPDFFGCLIDGRSLALECKRPGWSKPADDRERQQAAFLALIRELGGVGAFITDAEQVHALLA